MRFYQCSDNNHSTFHSTCHAEAIMIWLTKQMNTLPNQSFRGVFIKSFGQKNRKFPRKMAAVEPCFNKVTGQCF